MQQPSGGGAQFQTPSKLFPLLMNSGDEFSNYIGDEDYRDDVMATPSKLRQDMNLLMALRDWINLLVGLELVEIKTQNPLQSFLNCFKDGVLLCRIIEKIKLKTITYNKHPGGKEVVEKENFQTFLKELNILFGSTKIEPIIKFEPSDWAKYFNSKSEHSQLLLETLVRASKCAARRTSFNGPLLNFDLNTSASSQLIDSTPKKQTDNMIKEEYLKQSELDIEPTSEPRNNIRIDDYQNTSTLRNFQTKLKPNSRTFKEKALFSLRQLLDDLELEDDDFEGTDVVPKQKYDTICSEYELKLDNLRFIIQKKNMQIEKLQQEKKQLMKTLSNTQVEVKFDD